MLILIVEDEPAIARFLERGLNAHGHRILCAYDGEEGTRLAVNDPVMKVADVSPGTLVCHSKKSPDGRTGTRPPNKLRIWPSRSA